MPTQDASPTPIRIARVIARLNIGGPAQHVVYLSAGLSPDRFRTALLTGEEDVAEGSMRDLAAAAGVAPIAVPGLGRRLAPHRDLTSLVFLYRFFRRYRPHVVHTHTAKAGAVGRLAAWLARVPIVVHTYHGHVFHGYFSPVATRIFLGIERALARMSDRLLTVSDSVRDELIRYRIAPPQAITVLPLGLDLTPFLAAETMRGTLRAELGISGSVPLVGIVARLVPIKRHEDFLAAVALIVARRPDAVFLIVGDGERRAELAALTARMGLVSSVRFLGWRRDLARIYADLDVTVLTSANEGSPVSLIEAMAAACPVVATAVGGVPDIVEEGVCGRVVPAGDPAAVASAVLALLEDPERRRAMGLAGRTRVHPAFGTPRLVTDMERLYLDLLGQRERPGRRA